MGQGQGQGGGESEAESERYDSIHDIGVRVYASGSGTAPWAEVRAFTYPDGSYRNSLSAEELRDVANMLLEMADKMERTDE